MAKDSWLTVAPMSGTGNATIRNAGTTHTGRVQRSTVVTGTVKGMAAQSYKVNQKPSSEKLTLDQTVFNVAEGASTITISGVSNSPKIQFLQGSTYNIPITLPTIVKVNGTNVTAGENIPNDPGASAEYAFSATISIPKNSVGARASQIIVRGSSATYQATLTINQATSTYTVTYSKGNYINTITKVTEKVPYGGTASAVAAVMANDAQYTYAFDGWYEGSTKISSSLTLSVTNITSDRTFTAVATRKVNQYTITYTITPTGGGTAAPAGSYDYGTQVAITATPATGYNFSTWTVNGNNYSQNPLTVTMIENKAITAAFVKKTYVIAVNAQYRVAESGDYTTGTTGGTVTGGGTFEHGASKTVTASPATGYSFVGWYEGSTQVSTSAAYTFTVTSARTLTARFQRRWFTVTFSAGTGGSVSPTSARVQYGGSASSTATANTGYTFSKWSNNTTAATISLTNITADASYSATFTLNTYTITYTKNANIASITKTSESVNYGGTATNTATLPSNTAQYTYSFDGWYEGSTRIATTLSLSVANITASRTFQARGNATLRSYTLTVVNGSGSGTYTYGTEVTLTASTIAGKTFTKWSDGVTTATRKVTVTGNATYTAEYSDNTYTITYQAGTGISSVSKTSESVKYGGNATGSTATVATGYNFDGWYNGTTRVSTSLTYAPTNVTASATYQARGTIKSYTVTPSAYYRTTDGTGSYTSGTTGGTVSGGGSVNHGSSTTVRATAATGYKFDGWYSAGASGGSLLSSSTAYTISNVTGSQTVYARFTRIYFTVTYTTGNYVSSVSRSSERVVYGGSALGSTMTINSTTAQYSYAVDGWYNGSSRVSSLATYAPTSVTSDITLQARATRTLRSYTVTYNKGSYISSVSRASESVNYGSNALGSTATVQASDSDWIYSFDGWYNGSTRVSTALTYAPTNITGALTLEARATRTANSKTVTVSLESSSAGRGTVSGGGTFPSGSSVTVKCTLNNSNDKFDGWYNGSTRVSTSQNYTFTLTSNISLQAKILYLDVTPTSLDFVAGGETKTLTVKTNTSWTVS